MTGLYTEVMPETKRAVGAFIICPVTGRALLQQRDEMSDAPLTWGTFGGGVDEGEDLKQALYRELREECNFGGDIELIPLHKFTSADGGFEYFTYIGLVPEEFDPITNHETHDYKWFNAADKACYPMPLHPGLRDLIAIPERWSKILHYATPLQDQHVVASVEGVEASPIAMKENISRKSGLESLQVFMRDYQMSRGEQFTELGVKDGLRLSAFKLYGGWIILLHKEGNAVGFLQTNRLGQVDGVFLDKKYRGKNLGIVLYLAAVRVCKRIRSSVNIGIMAVKTWQKLSHYYNVTLHEDRSDKKVKFEWGKDGIPVVDGVPINDVPTMYYFEATK